MTGIAITNVHHMRTIRQIATGLRMHFMITMLIGRAIKVIKIHSKHLPSYYSTAPTVCKGSISHGKGEKVMKIGNKEVKEIVIKDSTGELIADITDGDIISKTNVIVELINTKEDKEMSLQEIQVKPANKLYEAIGSIIINELSIESAERIVDSLVKVMDVKLG